MVSRPFRTIAEQLGSDEGTVLACLTRFSETGVTSRIGPVFRPNTIGSSTLAAMSVPKRDLARVANRISSFVEVNHNYEREHRFNLWFVVAAATPARRDAVLEEIQEEIGIPVMSLPLIRDYYLDLGFQLDFSGQSQNHIPTELKTTKPEVHNFPVGGKQGLIEALQGGLPLVESPYVDLGNRTGLGERTVLERIHEMIDDGTIKRFGVVVRHHELGYRANAMCVWDAPDQQVDTLGQRLAKIPEVTLCYQRPRCLPDWPYNLFCMIHGKDRAAVLAQITRVIKKFRLENTGHAVLFSGQRFKQTGARFHTIRYSRPLDLGAAYG
jgi:DNA-binding Lrp family transcriptional regulator